MTDPFELINELGPEKVLPPLLCGYEAPFAAYHY